MNPDSAILSLIADLYAQVAAATNKITELESLLEEAQGTQQDTPPYDDV